MKDNEEITATITDELADERIDVALAKLTGLSRTTISNALIAGQITFEGSPVAKSFRVQAGQRFQIQIPKNEEVKFDYSSQTAKLSIIFEDQDLVVINKPVGMAAHPSPGWSGATVIGALAALGIQISTSGADERKGIVHRLDVGTTGLMVVAKSEIAYSNLKDQFRNRSVSKI